MRKQNSLFNKVVEFINNTKVGDTYRVSDLIAYAGPYEVTTYYKKSNGNPNYRIRSYQTMLRGPFLQNVKRGEWKVLQHIPEWFDLGHGKLMNAWYAYKEHPSNERILTYKGLTRNELLAKLGKPVYTSTPKIDAVDLSVTMLQNELGNAFSTNSQENTVTLGKINNLLKDQSKPDVYSISTHPAINETKGLLMEAATALCKIQDKDLSINARVNNIIVQITQLSNELN